MKTLLTGFALAAAFTLTAPAAVRADDNETNDRLKESAVVLQEIMSVPDKGIPRDLFEKASCVVVVPGLKKGAFIVGAKYGRGFFSCRTGSGWSAPAGVRVEGGSFGFQIGGSETDVVMLVMNDRGVDRLLSSKFTLGGDASVAAGPIGRTATAQTDAKMTAEILSWSRSRGVFAGIALDGATLREDDEANREMYGTEMKNRRIVKDGKVTPPAAAAAFLAELAKY
ncbi:MAG: lipid-binding SYLF domain-containing protein [Vicinamibacteraceae bacterium]|nr:lipid-binding SYLF domain-containing protein [Vicinamibacteraceae bacterium]